MTLPIVFRTDDRARWGPGVGHDLTESEVDRNFWELRSALQEFVRNPPVAKTIAAFELIPSTGLMITMSDGSSFGPFNLPVISWRWRGDWAPTTAYAMFDTFTVAFTGVYLVAGDHTSAMTFDAFARSEGGDALYVQLLGLEMPPLSLSDGTHVAPGVDTIHVLGATITDLGDGVVSVEVT